MAGEELLLAAALDAAVAGAACLLGVRLEPRVRASRLWFPVVVLFGSVTIFAVADAVGLAAQYLGDVDVARDFERVAYIGTGLAVPALANFATVYPRNIAAPWVRKCVVGLYILGVAFAALTPTDLLLAETAPAGSSTALAPGPIFWYIEGPLTLALFFLLGWALFLSWRGSGEVERRVGRGVSAMIGIPLIIGIAAYALQVNVLGPVDPIALAFAIWIALMGTLITRGTLAPAVPTTFYGLLNSVTEAVFVVASDGTVVNTNRAARDLLALGGKSLAPVTLAEVGARLFERAEDAKTFQLSTTGVLRGRLDKHDGIVEVSGAAPRTLRLRVVPLGGQNARGESEAALVMLADETRRVAAERATARSHDILDLVIRMLGHDLKAPLTVLQGYIDLEKARLEGLKGVEEAATVLRDLGKMSEAIVGMQVLMGNARALSRLAATGEEEPQLTEIDLAKVVRQAAEMMRPMAAGRQVKLDLQVAEGVRATVVPGFDSVPRNLVDNAIKYSPPGGTVSVTLGQADGWTRLEVADTGPGIPPEKLDQLFRKFERLGAERGPHEGHGLGLSIVAKLVEYSKGKVSAQEREDGKPGAVFRVEIPIGPPGQKSP